MTFRHFGPPALNSVDIPGGQVQYSRIEERARGPREGPVERRLFCGSSRADFPLYGPRERPQNREGGPGKEETRSPSASVATAVQKLPLWEPEVRFRHWRHGLPGRDVRGMAILAMQGCGARRRFLPWPFGHHGQVRFRVRSNRTIGLQRSEIPVPRQYGASPLPSVISASPQAFSFTVALHSRSGQALLAPAKSIQPQEKLSIDLQALLIALAGSVAPGFSDGSVAVYSNGTRTMLAGYLTMTDPAALS